jgi:hypothetical protein
MYKLKTGPSSSHAQRSMLEIKWRAIWNLFPKRLTDERALSVHNVAFVGIEVLRYLFYERTYCNTVPTLFLLIIPK